jgi:hypothetical protein
VRYGHAPVRERRDYDARHLKRPHRRIVERTSARPCERGGRRDGNQQHCGESLGGHASVSITEADASLRPRNVS